MTTRTQYESPDHLTDLVVLVGKISKDHEATLKALSMHSDERLARIRTENYQSKIAELLRYAALVSEFQDDASTGFDERDGESWTQKVLNAFGRVAQRFPVSDEQQEAA